jgi:hypothetical protein
VLIRKQVLHNASGDDIPQGSTSGESADRTKNMDRDIMDHDNGTGIGPCTKVLTTTFGAKIQAIVPGAFGEANKELAPLDWTRTTSQVLLEKRTRS